MSRLLHGGRVRRVADLCRGVLPISEHPRRRYRPDLYLGRHGELILRENLLVGDGASGLGDRMFRRRTQSRDKQAIVLLESGWRI